MRIRSSLLIVASIAAISVATNGPPQVFEEHPSKELGSQTFIALKEGETVMPADTPQKNELVVGSERSSASYEPIEPGLHENVHLERRATVEASSAFPRHSFEPKNTVPLSMEHCEISFAVYTVFMNSKNNYIATHAVKGGDPSAARAELVVWLYA